MPRRDRFPKGESIQLDVDRWKGNGQTTAREAREARKNAPEPTVIRRPKRKKTGAVAGLFPAMAR